MLLNGDELDRWMGDVVEAAGGDPAIVDLGARVPVKVAGESQGPEASRYDPHWWHDPRNAEAAVAAIRDALTKANPGARDVYARNAAAYLGRLRSLDRGIAACMSRVAPGARASSSPITTPSTTSPVATASRWWEPSSPRRARRPSRRRATWRG